MSEAKPDEKLTPQQQRAIETREVSIVLSSGAGCGKTHVLTQRYLSHLREGCKVEEIVAITFTDRAARQMRGKIREAILQLVRDTPSDEEAEFWARHLRDLENASICTIHSFCGTLLRQNALDAGLDPAFEVLEEVLAVNLRQEALESSLQRLLIAQSPIAEDLRELILLYGWRIVLPTIEQLLHDFDARGWQLWCDRPTEVIAQDWVDRARDEVRPRYLAQWVANNPAISMCLSLLRRYPPQPGAMSDAVELILRETPLLPQVSDLPAAIERLGSAAKVGRVGTKAWPDPVIYNQIKEAFERFRSQIRKLESIDVESETDQITTAITVGKRWLRVAHAAMTSYRERKQQQGVVDFQDLLLFARDLLRDRPEVRSGLQSRYRFLLIDELQDTDPVQMETVELLSGAGLTLGKLFAVGDHKQSIYRFRGADVSLFQHLGRRMLHEGRQTLSVNFRSQPAILQFVNLLLGDVLEDYEPLVPHRPQLTNGPCVEFLWSPRTDAMSVNDARAVEADWIARRILDMIDRETLVTEKTTQQLRAVRPGDIVILFRAMSNVHLYEAALRRQGLDYYLVGGRAFFAQQEIYDILNMLRTLENPQDEVSLAGVLRSPFCCLSDEALFVLAQHDRGLWNALFDTTTLHQLPDEQRPRVQRTAALLHSWREVKDRISISVLLQRIISDTGYDAALQMEFLGDRKLANLWKLLELARTFDRSALFGLAEFINRLGDLVTTQPREEQAATQPENADVIRIMSIHQAKGLEFPVVIVPDLAAHGGSNNQPVATWHGSLGCVARPPVEEDTPVFSEFGWRMFRSLEDLEEWAEDLRTLYVACTRPEDYLILSASLEAEYTPNGPWMQTLARHFDLQSGACLDPQACPVPSIQIRDAERPPIGLPLVQQAPQKRVTEIPPAPPRLRLCRGAQPVRLSELEQELVRPESLFPESHDLMPTRDDGLLRILDQWDFADPQGWKSLASQLKIDEAGIASTLLHFGKSRLCKKLASARGLIRRVPYLLALSSERDLPGVEGTIDCLYQTEYGWHLLEWVTQSISTSHRDQFVQRIQPRLALAAEAVRRFVEGEVRSVSLVFLKRYCVIELPLDSLRLEEVYSALDRLSVREITP